MLVFLDSLVGIGCLLWFLLCAAGMLAAGHAYDYNRLGPGGLVLAFFSGIVIAATGISLGLASILNHWL